MGKIIIKEKNLNESFEDIKDLLAKAHKENISNGFVMKTTKLNAEELKERIGPNGICFIALDKKKVVGTSSIRIVKRNTWYAKGEIPDYILAAVHPEYQGKHINSILANEIFAFAKKKGYELIELDTAANNKKAINIYKHQGFKLIGYKAFSGADHYSVVMVKWFDRCPYSTIYCNIRYNLQKLYIITRYKVGKIKRFKI